MPSKLGNISATRKLSEPEEVALCWYIDGLDKLGMCVRPAALRNATNLIISHSYNGESPAPVIGPLWIHRFLKRHPEYSVRSQKATDPNRKLASNMELVSKWYKKFCQVWKESAIQPEDFWNMDESGFMIGMSKNQKIITKYRHRQPYTGSSSNRELVTVVEAISAGGKTILPMVILAGKCHMACWCSNTGIKDDTLFAVSDSGFSNDQLSYQWVKHFDLFSARTQVGVHHLLLLDGYGSHFTYKFLTHCEDANIIPFCLPPHTTHFLQPLNITVFQPYKYWHAEAVDEATRTRCTNFNKIKFLHALNSI